MTHAQARALPRALRPAPAPVRRPSRGLRRSLGAVLATLTLATATSAVAGPAQAATGGGFVKTFAPENESGTKGRTATQAVNDARTFDVLVARQNTYKDHVGAMMQANPDLVLMAYMNGTFAQRSQGSTFPSSWYLRDAQGRKVTSRGYGNYLMNPRDPGWIKNRIDFCRTQMQRTGYKGCMLDMLGTAPTMPDYVSSPPINPVTRKAWTPRQWQEATTALATAVDAATTGALWGNGYGSGPRYTSSTWGPSSLLSAGVHGAITESWIRTSRESLTRFPGETEWKQSVDQLVDLGRKGEQTAVMVKLWANGTSAQKDRWHRYALASFMLGSNGRSSFHASFAHGDALAGHPYWKVDVGSPTSAYTKSSGVYQRSFQRGKVLVNSTTTARTVSLGGTYRDLSGTRRTSVTLPPGSGEVLVKA